MGGGHLIFFEMEFQTKSTESTESTCPATVNPCLACCKNRNKTHLPAGLRKERKVPVWNSFAVNTVGKYRIHTHKNEILVYSSCRWANPLNFCTQKRNNLKLFRFPAVQVRLRGLCLVFDNFHVFGCLRGLGNRSNQYRDGIMHRVDPWMCWRNRTL